MEFKFVILCLASCVFTMTTALKISTNTQDEEDLAGILTALQGDQSTSLESLDNLNVLPYEAGRKNFQGAIVANKPPFGLSLTTGTLVAGQLEILRLVESFLKLKAQIVGHLFAVFNDNWELIRTVANVLISNVPHLHAFSLKGISVIRKVLEFAVHAFADWNVSLPSVSFGAGYNKYVQPHETYGVPSVNVASFLEHFSQK